MDRRGFLGKTGYGLGAFWAARWGAPNVSRKKGSGSPGSDAVVVPSDFNALRSDFPPLKKWAYLATAFTGLVPYEVNAAHEAFLKERLHFGPFPDEKTILGVWLDRTEGVRKKLAVFLGAKDSEIAFTLCTACGSNIALNGIEWRKGDNAIIDDLDYPTDYHVLNKLRQKGVEVRIARNEGGAVPSDKFEALADKRTRAFIVSHVSYLNGYRHDLKKLADIVHAFGGYLIVDAAQSIGAVRIDVKEEDVDFMSGIPYKWLNAHNGVGFVYVREEIIPSVSPDRIGAFSTNDFVSLETYESRPLPENARRYEYGTLGFESIYGLEAAIDYIERVGIDAIEKRNLELIDLLREKLKRKGVSFFTPENNASPILSFFVQDEEGVREKMKERGVCITARRWARAHVRISPHFYNNKEDVNRFILAYDAILG